MVTQLIVRMTQEVSLGATNYFSLISFLNHKLTKLNRSHVLPQGIFSLSLPSSLASIARVHQLCHQLQAFLFSQQQYSFPPKELIENTNQAVWQDFCVAGRFLFVSYKSKICWFIPPSYSGPDLENTNRNEPWSQPELPPKEMHEDGFKTTNKGFLPWKPIGTLPSLDSSCSIRLGVFSSDFELVLAHSSQLGCTSS